jgi:ABC-type uncharacterized transport system ATPase subunit
MVRASTQERPTEPSPAPDSGPALVEAVGISKRFFGVDVNCDVDFEVRPGEVHALLGENGAGKSTLCSILAGAYRPDAGKLLVDGAPRTFHEPHDALDAGIGMVYQHYRLVDRFSVAENLFLGHPDLPFRLSARKLERRAREAMDEFGIYADPRSIVGELSVGEQQRVEILSLLVRRVRVLLLDEPTAVLTPQEVEDLFGVVRRLAGQGRGLVFVSHKLGEVFSACDRITVLRDGRRVGSWETAAADRDEVARLMVDRDVDDVRIPRRDRRPAQPVPTGKALQSGLTVRGLSVLDARGHERVRGLDLDVGAGEIVGIAGVSGNGQRELAEAIAGVRPAVAGTISLDGRDITRLSVRARAELGLAYVPEDRLATGMAAGLPLDDNIVLRAYKQPAFGSGPLLSRRRQSQQATELIEQFDIRGARPGLPVRVLSGGNLQRAILARELSTAPQVVIAAAPTRGLDIGATETIRRLLAEQRDRGSAVLLISEDLEEILELADRIAVLYSGRIVGEHPAATADVKEIGLMMAGGR